jgi:hypothetical protein
MIRICSVSKSPKALVISRVKGLGCEAVLELAVICCRITIGADEVGVGELRVTYDSRDIGIRWDTLI